MRNLDVITQKLISPFSVLIDNTKKDFLMISKWLHGPRSRIVPLHDLGKQTFDLTCQGNKIKHSQEEKVLGVTIDNKLNYKSHVKKGLQKR